MKLKIARTILGLLFVALVTLVLGAFYTMFWCIGFSISHSEHLAHWFAVGVYIGIALVVWAVSVVVDHEDSKEHDEG